MQRLRTLLSKKIFLLMIMSFSLVVSYYVCFAVAAAIVIYCLINNMKIGLDVGDVLLVAAMFSWKYFAGAGIIDTVVMTVGYETVYLAGKTLIDSDAGDYDCVSGTWMATLFLTAFTLIKAFANYSYLIHEHVTEEWPNWRGEIITRTHHEFYLTLAASLFAFFMLGLLKEKKRLYFVCLLLSLFALYIGLYTEGRLAFFCSLSVLMVVLVAVVIEDRLYGKRWFIVCSVLFVLLAITFGIAFFLNIAGLYDAYKDSMWSGSGGIIHNTRVTLQRDTILKLKEYPFGQNNEMLTEYNGVKTPYAHNTWLDIGKEGGIIPLLLLIGFSVYNIVCLVTIWIRSKDSIKKYAVISAFVGVSMYNMAEPGIKSDPMIWAVEIFIGGLAVGASKCLKPLMETVKE